jgi:hypothetical protein
MRLWTCSNHLGARFLLLLHTRASGLPGPLHYGFPFPRSDSPGSDPSLVGKRTTGKQVGARFSKGDRIFPAPDRNLRRTLSHEELSQRNQRAPLDGTEAFFTRKAWKFGDVREAMAFPASRLSK